MPEERRHRSIRVCRGTIRPGSPLSVARVPVGVSPSSGIVSASVVASAGMLGTLASARTLAGSMQGVKVLTGEGAQLGVRAAEKSRSEKNAPMRATAASRFTQDGGACPASSSASSSQKWLHWRASEGGEPACSRCFQALCAVRTHVAVQQVVSVAQVVAAEAAQELVHLRLRHLRDAQLDGLPELGPTRDHSRRRLKHATRAGASAGTGRASEPLGRSWKQEARLNSWPP